VSVACVATIRDLNRALNWDLPDDEAVTVAGLLIHEARRIPEAGQTFTFHHHRFSVLERKANRITKLQIWPAPERSDG
jgi:magnesium and cobalt exporter, CNNM family